MDKNLYILTGENYMIRKSVTRLEESLDIQHPQLNIVDFKTMPKADELKDACLAVPFMANKRLVIVSDCTVLSKGSAEEAKRISAFLEKIPESTVLVLCIEGAADKRRVLYKQINKRGIVRDFAAPRRAESIGFVVQCAKEQGASISRKAAEMVVDAVGYDYYALDNETAKLAVYSGFKEIKPEHVSECVSATLEYNVFELHGLLIGGKANDAKLLLDDIMRSERPEALTGLIARKVRDMYKVRALLDAGYSYGKIASAIGVKGFVAEIISKECRKFTQNELRNGLKVLADLDYSVKSGEKDAYLALPETLLKVYKL